MDRTRATACPGRAGGAGEVRVPAKIKGTARFARIVLRQHVLSGGCLIQDGGGRRFPGSGAARLAVRQTAVVSTYSAYNKVAFSYVTTRISRRRCPVAAGAPGPALALYAAGTRTLVLRLARPAGRPRCFSQYIIQLPVILHRPNTVTSA